MKLEQQVVSLELAQKLKELGVVQKSLFYIDEQDQEITYGMFAAPTFPGHTYISTFTVAELYSLLYSNGICDILITVKPEELADHLAQLLCTKLENK